MIVDILDRHDPRQFGLSGRMNRYFNVCRTTPTPKSELRSSPPHHFAGGGGASVAIARHADLFAIAAFPLGLKTLYGAASLCHRQM
jgi:hypothetical protein